MEPPDTLQIFRRSFYECLHRREDALFELADAILAADERETPVYAVDASVWPRCDAECSPQRGFYYHPATPPASPSSQAGLTSSSHSWALPARVGPPPWTWSVSDQPKTLTWSPQGR